MSLSTSAAGFLKELERKEKAIKSIAHKLAPIAVGMVQQNMDGPFKPNAPLTRRLKNGGSRPLRDTGETRASISSYVRNDTVFVGTNKPHAPLINNGGTIKPKRSRRLAIPTTRQVKKRSDALGVKKTLTWLEDNGWKIFFRPKSIMGRAPVGAKPFGLKIKSKHNKNARKRKDGSYSENAKGVFYVLFYRSSGIKVPKREFMYLKAEQEEMLKSITMKALEN
ncbi:HK97 gp10 family phage protein [Vibrio sp. OPT18]|uniref:HK97 gp10 family phage protein n=1 Tax=Vibrio sp. OPT18 TaxID=2778641 RepID=UPI0018800AC1|nr:HK97 gp10 family phage protein [Vibrio sp. OPT18]MBE8578708.1 HK97 gp10 family phage protein [Vibrio sp. OPT18]